MYVYGTEWYYVRGIHRYGVVSIGVHVCVHGIVSSSLSMVIGGPRDAALTGVSYGDGPNPVEGGRRGAPPGWRHDHGYSGGLPSRVGMANRVSVRECGSTRVWTWVAGLDVGMRGCGPTRVNPLIQAAHHHHPYTITHLLLHQPFDPSHTVRRHPDVPD